MHPEKWLNQISLSRIRHWVEQLEGPRHRLAAPTHHAKVEAIIEDAFRSWDYQVEKQEFVEGTYQGRNIIARREGYLYPEKEWILCAHYDTVEDSPGADDNASAVAALLEIARVCASSQFAFTLTLIAFDGEELDRAGSRAFVTRARAEQKELVGALDLEMIGYADPRPGSQHLPEGFQQLFPEAIRWVRERKSRGDFLVMVGNSASGKLLERAQRTLSRFLPELPALALEVPGRGELAPDLRRSDHSSFWDVGVPALMFTDGAEYRNPHYHQSTDLANTLDYAFLTQNARGLLAILLQLLGPARSYQPGRPR